MRIGIVGTLWLNTPPVAYGGTEEVVANLVNGLSKKGHDVTFFGPATAIVDAKIIPTVERPLRDMDISWEDTSYTLYHLITAFAHAKEFDILYMHLNKQQDYVSLPFSVYKNTPTLFTVHFRMPDANFHSESNKIIKNFTALPYSSISNAQASKEFNFIATIYNSIRFEAFPFSDKTDEYFVWLGKIMPKKGTKDAILAAKKAKKKLYVLGAIDSGVEEYLRYFEEEVKPLIDGKDIVFYENVGVEQKANILGKAKALLNPIAWDEPFGLVMIESQACGTPVIAYKRGATAEVIQDGKTGFLVENVDDMVEAMRKVDTLSRIACREFVKKQFSLKKMVEGYERAYDTVIKNWPKYHRKQIHQMELGSA